MRLRLILAAALAVLLTAPAKANAQDVKGIGLTPALQELTLQEGQASTDFSISLSNSTDAAIDLRLLVYDFGALDESGGIAFLGRAGRETTKYGLRLWASLEKDRVYLEPGESESVKITVNNRENLSPGGHYGAIIVSAAGEGGEESIAVMPAASTLVLLKKIGGEVMRLELDSVNTNKSWFRMPRETTLRFNNTGNTHLVPRGTVELFGPTGSKLARGVVNPQSGFVLPESYRQIKVSLSGGGQPWLPGRYRLVTTWRYDGTEETTVHEEQYWYIGTLALWAMVVSSLVIVLIMFVRYRRRPLTRGQ